MDMTVKMCDILKMVWFCWNRWSDTNLHSCGSVPQPLQPQLSVILFIINCFFGMYTIKINSLVV